MINWLFWNARGVAKSITVSRIKLFIRLYKLQIVALCEPLVGSSRIQFFQRRIRFSDSFTNNSNRIWIFLAAGWSGIIIDQSDQFLALKLKHVFAGEEVIFVAVHAHATNAARSRLWPSLLSLNELGLPVIFAGDFNVILVAEEKKGGRSFQFSEAADFSQFMSLGV